eukprot:525920-Rhodomonas_salina.1
MGLQIEGAEARQEEQKRRSAARQLECEHDVMVLSCASWLIKTTGTERGKALSTAQNWKIPV